MKSFAERPRDSVSVEARHEPGKVSGPEVECSLAELERVAPGARSMERSRRDLLRAGGAAAVASMLGVFGIAAGAAAGNGDAVRAGRRTTATRGTTLDARAGSAFEVRTSASGEAAAVRALATAEQGETVGVHGQAASSEGTAGRFVATGGGTAVVADASQRNGVALRTQGRIEIAERSGVAPVSGGAEFVIPVRGGLSDRSIVLATLQDHFPGVHVESAHVLDAEEGLIVVRLNQAVPEPARVGWLVLD